ncbi:adenylate/guanylate cyclase domain-containing protein [Seohaeicola zhoushanensis]
MGDGALVEFASVVDAVNCALDIQRGARAQSEPLELRIGVNMGDVIAQGRDIYGDGVNIAARLEGLAEPGGICLSGIVHQSVGRRIEATFADAGEHQLKNIAEPVRVFRWVPEGGIERLLAPARPGRSDKPGIAVLALDNMSADPEQEYFSDGIAEDIITALSHFREFRVIARNTSFTYKGLAINVGKVCRELGVRYLLEGSVRKADNRVRVTAQLIDGETGAHIWADRYDRELDDIFAVQDEMTRAIVTAVAPQALGAELERARQKAPGNLDAWDKLLQARWHMSRMTRAENAAGRALLEEAIAEAPDMSDAYATLALTRMWDMLHLWGGETSDLIRRASAEAQRAIELDQTNANAYALAGMVEGFARNFEVCESHYHRAIQLNPNLANAHGNLCTVQGLSGDYEGARASANLALDLSPLDPMRCFWLGGVGIGAFVVEAYEDCVAVSRQVLKDFPGYASSMRQEAAALAMLGREAEAHASAERLLERMPGLTVSQVRTMVPVRAPEAHERWLEALRRAGVPD